LLLACGLLSCTRPKPKADRSDKPALTLLEVCLAMRTSANPGGPVDDLSKEARPRDTVQVFPVVMAALGEKMQDTVYLSNTTRLGRVGRYTTFGQGWRTAGRVNIWSSLKDDISIEWYNVEQSKKRLGKRQIIRYRPVRLSGDGWYRECTGQHGNLRLLVKARYGRQVIANGSINTEREIGLLPQIKFSSEQVSQRARE
jgi:hypothetical protein